MKKKLEHLEKLFSLEKTEKELYKEIILFGSTASNFPSTCLTKEHLIRGCQSALYLTHFYKDQKLTFFIHSEALISKGLASLLVYMYSNEEPKKLFTNPPLFLQELPILKKISMSRQTGIKNLFTSMRLIASKYI